MRTQTPHFIMGGLLVSCIALSVALFPKETEIALMHLRAHDINGAQKIYSDAYTGGNHSASVTAGLAQTEIEGGNINSAIAVVQRYLKDNPKDIAAQKLLAEYYREAQQTTNYYKALQDLQKVAPDGDRALEIENIADLREDMPVEMEVIKERIARYNAEAVEYDRLARMQTALGDAAAALDTLTLMVKAHPDADTDQNTGFRLFLLYQLHRNDQALAEARQWLAVHPKPDSALLLTDIVRRHSGSGAAVELLKPFIARPNPPLSVVLTLATYLGETNREAEAYGLIKDYAAHHPLDSSLVELSIQLAIDQHDYNAALQTADRAGLKTLMPDTLVALGDIAQSIDRIDFVRRILSEAGPDTLALHPLTAARLTLYAGDKDAARHWADTAETTLSLDMRDQLALAQVEAQLGESDKALARFQRYAGANPPRDLLEEEAGLYVQLDRAAEGEALFARLRREQPSPEADYAWALTAVANKDAAAVSIWLASATSLSDSQLEALFWTAHDRGFVPLALSAAQRLEKRGATVEHRAILAEAQEMSGHYADAVETMRPLRGTSPDLERRYGALLIDAYRHGLTSVGPEATSWWEAALHNAKTPADSQEALFALVDLKDSAVIVGPLEKLAVTDPQRWLDAYLASARATGQQKHAVALLVDHALHDPRPTLRPVFAAALIGVGTPQEALPALRMLAMASGRTADADAYEDALRKLGRTAELRQFMAQRIRRPGLTPDERRDLAYGLLDLGDKASALGAFQLLAAQESPSAEKTPDLDEVMFLSGPRPGPEVMNWLEARGRAATSPADKAAWMSRLVDVGAPERALAIAGDARNSESSTLRLARIDALAARTPTESNQRQLTAAIAAEVPRTTDTKVLAHLTDLAQGADDTRTRYRAAAAWAAAQPSSRPATRSAGMAAFESRDFPAATRYFAETRPAAARDWEVEMNQGEIALRNQDADKAAPAFKSALADNQAVAKPDFEALTGRAHLLYRTGQPDAADRLYRRLLAERPYDKNLRADYADMLIDTGANERALAVANGGTETP